MFKRLVSYLVDGSTTLLLNSAQFRSPDEVCTRAQLERYLTEGERTTREEFFAVTPMSELKFKGSFLGWQAPTLIFLHALMSASDFGYCRIARRLNRAGWNSVLVHLPFHYSRIPRGRVNGALALTSNLPRNGETIRQAVKEVRQVLGLFRDRGCGQFGLIGTSFGGWIGALISFLEKDLSYVALLRPVADVEYAIWESPAGRAIRSQLDKASIPVGITRRHAHLTSPMDGQPLCDADRILLVGGRYDAIVPLGILRNLRDAWPGSRLIEVNQGHFGYSAMRAALREFEAFRMLGKSTL